MIDKERLKLGLDALRSGEYRQCTGTLLHVDDDGNKSYCCLGVLTDVAIKNGLEGVQEVFDTPGGEGFKVSNDQRRSGEADFVYAFLPHAVKDWYGFESIGPSVTVDNDVENDELTHLNDDLRWDFNQIADAIEATYITGEA